MYLRIEYIYIEVISAVWAASVRGYTGCAYVSFANYSEKYFLTSTFWLVTWWDMILSFSVKLERLARRCRSMTWSPVIGRKVVDVLQHFRLSVNSLRVYAIS
jgi:hypothetical protein